MEPDKEVVGAYHTLMRYSRQFNDILSRPSIDVNYFKKFCGILYFNLTNQEEELEAGSTKLEFKLLLAICMY